MAAELSWSAALPLRRTRPRLGSPAAAKVYHDPGVWSRQDFLLDQGITSTATVAFDRVERMGQTAPSLLCR